MTPQEQDELVERQCICDQISRASKKLNQARQMVSYPALYEQPGTLTNEFYIRRTGRLLVDWRRSWLDYGVCVLRAHDQHTGRRITTSILGAPDKVSVYRGGK
jgi:hypothetical protein